MWGKQKIFKKILKGVYLPGPAVWTDIFSINHSGENGGIGGGAAPVG